MKRVQGRAKSMGLVAGVCGALAMIVTGQTAFSQPAGAPASVKANAPAASAAAEAEQPAKPRKPGSEGITVHGHWVIDVKNPDGTLAEHRVFENSLVDNGFTLVSLLGGYSVPGDFVVFLNAATPGSVAICPSGSCGIVQSTTSTAGFHTCSLGDCQAGLVKTVNATPPGPYSMVLSGQFTATQAGGSVANVQTSLAICGSTTVADSTTTPSACPTGTPEYTLQAFTGTNITAIPVALGQVVQVSVTITFS